MKKHLWILLTLLTISVGFGQSTFLNQLIEINEDSIGFLQLKSNAIFSSNQVISLLVLQKNYESKFGVEFGYNQTDLKTTSSIAKSKNAVAAINGGFFNMDSGGSVTYFEINDAVVNRTRGPNLKWGVTDSLMNGAIVISKEAEIIIQPANTEQFYESSKQESAVLITGPLLLLNSEKVPLANKEFVHKRHPRTCLCISKEALVFITIDGRNKEAEGMNLFETQKFLLKLGCIDAINLDGGGSTTMWTKNKGVVNFPSDKSGERRVSNALLIMNKQ